MSYFELFLSNRRLLTFGILLTFFSGFGKTFLISLYVPYFISEFELSKTSFSAIYAVTTIASGVCILYLGALIDQTKLKYYTLMVAVGLIASCILLNVSYNIWFLALGIFGLRLAGQGLMIHTSVTAITKYFRRSRGKAVSIALLGHPLGEAILPGIVAILISIVGWRSAILYSADFMALILIPMVLFLLRRKPKVVEVTQKEEKAKVKKTSVKKVTDKEVEWSIGKVLRDKRFYFIAPSVACLAGVNTALMFYMIPIAESKGWSAEWMAVSFAGFALGNSSATLGVGPLIDKFRASRLFPFYILPLALALIV
ncbi:MAG TPA: MFS transporter, partial [Cytophagaceae bacterium]